MMGQGRWQDQTKTNELKFYLKMVSKQIWKYRNTVAVSSSIHTVQNLSKFRTEFQLGQRTPKQEKITLYTECE